MKLTETTVCPVQIIESDRSKLPETVLCRVVYPICNIGELNANNRLYEQDVWEKVLADETIQEKMSSRTLYGQAEHPEETQSDLRETSHIITRTWIDEDNKHVLQEIDVIATPTGKIIDTLLRAGCRVGVSTRAEGDLEEFEIEEGKTCQRVIAESYRYVTTDFTADPSTFNVEPLTLQKNVAPMLKREMESNSKGRQFARLLYESIQKPKKDEKVEEGHTSISVTTDDGQQVSVEAEGNISTTTSADGTVSVTPEMTGVPGTVPPEGAVPPFEPGEKEDLMGEIEGELEGEPEEKMPESKLTEEEWAGMNMSKLDEVSLNEPAGFQSCVDRGGRVRRVSGEKEHGLGPNEYVNYCYLDGKSYRGEVKKVKEAASVKKSKARPLHRPVKESVRECPYCQYGMYPYDEPLSPNAIVCPRCGASLIDFDSEQTKSRLPDSSHTSSQEESKQSVLEYKVGTKVWVGDGPDKGAAGTVESVMDGKVTVALKSGEAKEYPIDVLYAAPVEESKNPMYKEHIDLRVKEASVRAERDKLLETAKEASDAALQIRILRSHLEKIQEQSKAEIDGLRSLLEKKAKEAGVSKEQLKEAIVSRKTKAETKALHSAYQKKLTKIANESKAKGRIDVLKEYFERCLSTCGLQVDNNSRALLESCKDLVDVDALLDKLIGVARRSALHSRSLSEIKVQNVVPIDPEQKKVDEAVGSLMSHIG